VSLLLRGGRRADGSQVDVRCEGERVTAVAPTLAPEPGDEVVALDGWLLLGAPGRR
jgi:dihydroorotase-like cyclic amidohydrolase